MPLKDRLGAVVPTGELDTTHGPTCLDARLVPEERHQPSHLYEGGHTVVHIYGLFCLHKVSYMTVIIDTSDIEPEGRREGGGTERTGGGREGEWKEEGGRRAGGGREGGREERGRAK